MAGLAKRVGKSVAQGLNEKEANKVNRRKQEQRLKEEGLSPAQVRAWLAKNRERKMMANMETAKGRG